jgi:hypothetical protein
MEGLKPGRIVYFRHRDGGESPAMVVKVWNDQGYVNLYVFPDGSNDHRAYGGVEQRVGRETSVEYSEADKPFSWHWMFEGQQARYQPDRVEKPA